MKTFDTKHTILFCLADFAKGIFTGMIANYLIYFFQPTTQSGISPVITQGLVVFGFLTLIGVIKSVGHIIDAFTDPMIASMSDKSKNKKGRRIPFMRFASIPYGLCALLIFCPPMKGVHWINNVWVAVFMFLYFLFYTIFMIPHGALFPEIIRDHNKRLTAYSISSFFFVAGSAVIYATPIFVKMFKDTGLSANLSYQLVFAILTVIGIILLLITSFSIKEKEYVQSTIPTDNLFKGIKLAFKNKEFAKITIGQLLQTASMAFFQATIMYYVTVLLGLDEASSPIILGLSIVASIAMYPIIVKISRKFGKKLPLIVALIWFVVAYLIIYFIADVPGSPWVKGIFFALFVSYPFGALNVLPNAIMSDVIQYDTIVSGENKEGIFSAARSFVTKLGQSLALIIIPSVLAIGAASGEGVGREGIKLTALVAAVFCLLSVIFFIIYNDKKIISTIETHKKETENEQI